MFNIFKEEKRDKLGDDEMTNNNPNNKTME
jgi:hypothetical protein